jgi:hypothetical protein
MQEDIIKKFREKWKTLVFNIPNTDINVVDEKAHEWVELILISLLSAVSQAKEEGRKQGVEEAIKALPKFTSYGNESEDFVKARATGKNSYRSEALAVLKSLIN